MRQETSRMATNTMVYTRLILFLAALARDCVAFGSSARKVAMGGLQKSSGLTVGLLAAGLAAIAGLSLLWHPGKTNSHPRRTEADPLSKHGLASFPGSGENARMSRASQIMDEITFQTNILALNAAVDAAGARQSARPRLEPQPIASPDEHAIPSTGEIGAEQTYREHVVEARRLCQLVNQLRVRFRTDSNFSIRGSSAQALSQQPVSVQCPVPALARNQSVRGHLTNDNASL